MIINGINDWFYCTYHANACQINFNGELRCKDGDGTYRNHCTCIGPFLTKQAAENSEHAQLRECGCVKT